MFLMLRPARGRELLFLRDEKGLSEPLNAQLSCEIQSRRSEQHFLPHWRRIGDIGNSSVAILSRVIELKQDIGGLSR